MAHGRQHAFIGIIGFSYKTLILRANYCSFKPQNYSNCHIVIIYDGAQFIMAYIKIVVISANQNGQNFAPFLVKQTSAKQMFNNKTKVLCK
jgi:hypothetical protein